MKIEKVNDNQIRCTLTKKDLADRQIRLSELAYGSEKAKTLFRDMIQQANYEFGFEANDIPLMVEAIPMSADSITLIITKVEYPEELDTRFSKFSEPDDAMFEDKSQDTQAEELTQGADDILGIFRKFRKSQEGDCQEEITLSPEEVAKLNEHILAQLPTDLIKMFEFSTIEEIGRLGRMLGDYYHGVNDLYFHEKKNRYYLFVHKNNHTPEEFNKICNIVSEYGMQRSYTDAIGAHFAEHCKMILKEQAVQILASL